jgi:hypothetical protein
MADAERVYEYKRVATGWRHVCEWHRCPRGGEPFISKRKARFCCSTCRTARFNSDNREARRLCRERGLDTAPRQE